MTRRPAFALLITLGAQLSTLPAEAANTITVVSANYGWNVSNGVDATSDVAGRCDGKTLCDYLVDVFRLGDPAPFKQKAFRARFRCGVMSPVTVSVNPEANQQTVRLGCE